MKKLIFSVLMALAVIATRAQVVVEGETYNLVKSDTVSMVYDGAIEQPTDDQYRIVTNRFWDNWFLFGNVGAHAFFGDYSGEGKFSHRITPDFYVGAGKWFTPGIGAKLQFGLSNSKSYTMQETNYMYGNPLRNDKGQEYWKTKIKWWDLSISAMFNLTRLFKGYEGLNSDRLMNQFILSTGIGATHHFDTGGPQLNEWSGHLEFQYSRFFNRKKNWSLDLRFHGLFYQTNFDNIVTKKDDPNSNWFDSNLGFSIGATYYLKQRGWERCRIEAFEYDKTINIYVNKPQECDQHGVFTFFIFYPNNYSGRNDAPIVADAPVNAIHYLAGGLFTQKKFADNSAVKSRLSKGSSLSGLKTEDNPTRNASFIQDAEGLALGYELADAPLSLSMDATALKNFKDKMEYYYAPIYDGSRTWYYRIDEETKGQSLTTADNYKDTESYGLNGQRGLSIVKENMPLPEGSDLYSFADVYAALEGNDGYIKQYANQDAVAALQNIFRNGQILDVYAEGLATSQDNYIGADAEKVGDERNRTLSFNRAKTAIQWLRGSNKFHKAGTDFVINALAEPIGEVKDTSTRGLNAKLNRCVRVQVRYMIPSGK